MTTVAPPDRPRRLLLVLGPMIAILGVIAYVVQVSLGRLGAPWYMPIAATLGALLVSASLRQRRSLGRIVLTVALVLFAGATWAFLLGTRLPAYTGPLAVGKPFPAFATLRADGTSFTQADLVGPQNSVLVFFRGRW
jgi:hypothetical protein